MDRPSIRLRLPRDLSDELRSTAEAQGISLNSLLMALIAGSVGWTLDKAATRQRTKPESWLPVERGQKRNK